MHSNGSKRTPVSAPLLIGNAFPLTLVRRPLAVTPKGIDDLRAEIARRSLSSFWGHENTLAAASQIAGASLKPNHSRAVITLSPDGLPDLEGQTFRDCWVLSPNYATDFRPSIGREVHAKQIASWQALRIEWR